MSESINKIKVKDITYDVEDSIARGSAIQDSSLQITTASDSVSISYTDLEGETFEVPIPAATTEKAGVMSAEDKKKLDELGEEVVGIVEFEQGTLISGSNSESNDRIRTVGFIDSWFSIKLKEGYEIYRVSRYNKDNTYNSYIEVNSNFYENQDSTYKHRFTIIKTNGSNISPNDDFLAEYKAGMNYMQSKIKNLSYIDLTDMLEWGYYKTSETGVALGEIVDSTVRKHLYVANLQDGDTYVVRAVGGSTSYVWAKIKEGVIISSGNSKSEVVIQCDGSFDSLIFNVDTREDYYLFSYLNNPNSFFSKAIKDIDDNIESLYLKTAVIGTTSLILEQGTLSLGNEQDASNRLRSGIIDSGFFVSLKDGYQIYRLVEYAKDGTFVKNITLSKSYAYVPNKDGMKYRILVTKKNINTDLSPSDEIVEEYADGIRYSEKMIQSGESLYYNFHNANIVVIGDSAVAASDWANRMCNDIKCNKHIVSAVGGQTLRTRLTSNGSLDNCLRKNLENTVIPHIDNNWDGKVDIIMIQEGGNDLGSISGSLDDAFSDTNYLNYKENLTTYGSLRYCLELLKRKYPSCLIVMGTVFGRRGSDWNGNADSINEVITNMCQRFAIQVIDGNQYCGFAPILEPIEPYYGDGAPGVVGGGGTLSRELPAYNYVDADNNIVDYETATDNGVLKEGYSKRYGLYTYDGKHQNLQGEEKVLKFMKAELVRLYTK